MKDKIYELIEIIKKNNRLKYILIGIFLILFFLVILSRIKQPSINEDEYQYYLKLAGNDNVLISVGDKYYDEGYFAYDNKGNNLYEDVEVVGTYDTSKIGEYTITYKLKDIVLYRVIKVVPKADDENNQDSSNLTIKLNGESVVYVLKNKVYNDESALAFDLYDGDLTSKIITSGTVNTSKPGVYTLNYEVTNNRGVTKSVKRQVIVYEVLYSLDKKCTSSRCEFVFTFKNNYYKSITLPNGTSKTSSTVNYTIQNNGTYNFLIYDIYGNQIIEKVIVSSIDTRKPVASCNLYLYDDNSKITVNASDLSGIKGYIYNYGTNKTNLLESNTFIYQENINTASVIVYDNNNNSTKVDCNVIDASTKYSRSYTKYRNDYDYWVYIPGTLSKRKTVPLVVYLHGSGECGSGVNNNSLPYYIKKGQDYDFIMVAPQLPSDDCGSGFYAREIMDIIEIVMEKYPIDPNRVIITGFSLGGNGTYRMLKDYPNFFASGIPLAARTGYEENLTKTPIWAFHGSDDPYVSYREEMQTMEKVISINPNSKYTLLEGKGHIIYDLVYKNQEVLDWIMNSYRK